MTYEVNILEDDNSEAPFTRIWYQIGRIVEKH